MPIEILHLNRRSPDPQIQTHPSDGHPHLPLRGPRVRHARLLQRLPPRPRQPRLRLQSRPRQRKVHRRRQKTFIQRPPRLHVFLHFLRPDDNEIEILSSIRCSRFVNLLGYTSGVANQQQQRLLVVEYMANGTLHDNLHSSVDSGGNSSDPPGWIDRVRWAHQIARAVDSLHSMDPPVIHRDIKSSNVLIDRRRDARLGDFGLAVRLTADPFRCTARPAGTLGYIDPAYVTPEDLSVKSDVFSFGILLLEMMSGRKAIDVGYSPPSAVDWASPIIGRRGFVELCDPRIGPPGIWGWRRWWRSWPGGAWRGRRRGGRRWRRRWSV
ncbi:Serine/threonine-protein kinase-like protein [Acorus calamus]|uniref:Serine/threonine-protein kinase-like protein n=1 Tax=Acorus calamus TaxID=4465 RepID=A0AAV9CI86_ACOCL|nr:Serine/threonine-protein kinase-like protein [Acorus calamus]